MTRAQALRRGGTACAWLALCAPAGAQQGLPQPVIPQPQVQSSPIVFPQTADPASASSGMPPVTAQPPVPAVPGGACVLVLSTDRTTLRLQNPATQQERKHLSLGQDRVQQVYTAPDGAWSVAVFKVRGADEFGFIAIDLAACDDQLPTELPALATAATFEADAVTFEFSSSTQRYALRRPRIR